MLVRDIVLNRNSIYLHCSLEDIDIEREGGVRGGGRERECLQMLNLTQPSA